MHSLIHPLHLFTFAACLPYKLGQKRFSCIPCSIIHLHLWVHSWVHPLTYIHWILKTKQCYICTFHINFKIYPWIQSWIYSWIHSRMQSLINFKLNHKHSIFTLFSWTHEYTHECTHLFIDQLNACHFERTWIFIDCTPYSLAAIWQTDIFNALWEYSINQIKSASECVCECSASKAATTNVIHISLFIS